MTQASIHYQGEMQEKPAYYATDYTRDRLALQSIPVEIHDRRSDADPPQLDREGFMLARHQSPGINFLDEDAVGRTYVPEMGRLLAELTGASRVLMNPRAVLRFSERSDEYGSRMNTRPARFVHVDYSRNAIPILLPPLLEANGLQEPPGRYYAGFNLWRVLSPPPQDVPLCVCDMRSLSPDDLVAADAIFDAPGRPEFGFEGYLLHYNPAHRWSWYSDMHRDEALVFRSFDSRGKVTHCVPHVAFENPDCPPGAEPRASIEVRGFAFYD